MLEVHFPLALKLERNWKFALPHPRVGERGAEDGNFSQLPSWSGARLEDPVQGKGKLYEPSRICGPAKSPLCNTELKPILTKATL